MASLESQRPKESIKVIRSNRVECSQQCRYVLAPRSWKGQLIGYISDSIYKIWNPKARDVHRARDVSFIEEQTPIQADNLEGQEQEAEEFGAIELTPRRSRAFYERLEDDTQESREPSHAPSTLSHITVQGAEPHQTSCQPESEAGPAEESATEPAEGSATELASEEAQTADDDPPPLRELRRCPKKDYQTLHPGAYAVTELDTPGGYNEAMNSKDAKKWREAMDSEFKALQQNHTWDLAELPAGRKAIKGRWVHVRKLKTYSKYCANRSILLRGGLIVGKGRLIIKRKMSSSRSSVEMSRSRFYSLLSYKATLLRLMCFCTSCANAKVRLLMLGYITLVVTEIGSLVNVLRMLTSVCEKLSAERRDWGYLWKCEIVMAKSCDV